jgi:hypothetical protein
MNNCAPPDRWHLLCVRGVKSGPGCGKVASERLTVGAVANHLADTPAVLGRLPADFVVAGEALRVITPVGFEDVDDG